MSRGINFALVIVLTAVVVAFIIPTLGQQAQAQENCKAFHVIVQARLYDPFFGAPPTPYTPGWSGPFSGTLDGVPVAGFLSYAEPPSVDFPPPGDVNKGKVGKETNVIFKFEVMDPAGIVVGSFQSVKDFGVFPVPPSQGLGNYSGTARIDDAKGTGIFDGASGFFTIAGPASGPFIPPPAILQYSLGFWNPEVNGKICAR